MLVEFGDEAVVERPLAEAFAMLSRVLIRPKRIIWRDHRARGGKDILAFQKRATTDGTRRPPKENKRHDPVPSNV